jgi:hypothetical protein
VAVAVAVAVDIALKVLLVAGVDVMVWAWILAIKTNATAHLTVGQVGQLAAPVKQGRVLPVQEPTIIAAEGNTMISNAGLIGDVLGIINKLATVPLQEMITTVEMVEEDKVLVTFLVLELLVEAQQLAVMVEHLVQMDRMEEIIVQLLPEVILDLLDII